MKKVLVILYIVLVLLWSCGTAYAESQGKGRKAGQPVSPPPGWKQGKKQGWKTEFPPGWESWSNAKRQQWKHDLERAKNAVRKHAEARLNAALGALEMAARKGVPLQQAEETAKAGLDNGLGPFDFEPLGKFVVERVKAGVKGEALARAIHEQINRRRQERERLRQQMKEKIKQGQQDRKRLHKKLKQEKEPGKPQRGRSPGKRARPHLKQGKRNEGKKGQSRP